MLLSFLSFAQCGNYCPRGSPCFIRRVHVLDCRLTQVAGQVHLESLENSVAQGHPCSCLPPSVLLHCGEAHVVQRSSSGDKLCSRCGLLRPAPHCAPRRLTAWPAPRRGLCSLGHQLLPAGSPTEPAPPEALSVCVLISNNKLLLTNCGFLPETAVCAHLPAREPPTGRSGSFENAHQSAGLWRRLPRGWGLPRSRLRSTEGAPRARESEARTPPRCCAVPSLLPSCPAAFLSPPCCPAVPLPAALLPCCPLPAALLPCCPLLLCASLFCSRGSLCPLMPWASPSVPPSLFSTRQNAQPGGPSSVAT